MSIGIPEILKMCGSPIERIMASSIDRVMRDHDWHGNGYFALEWRGVDMAAAVQPCTFNIFPQKNIGPYCADFFASHTEWDGSRVFAAIECDGHDYHDLTKHQAIHDRCRDRYFQSLGILILRFTGSEIFTNPLKSASHAFLAMDSANLAKWRQQKRETA